MLLSKKPAALLQKVFHATASSSDLHN